MDKKQGTAKGRKLYDHIFALFFSQFYYDKQNPESSYEKRKAQVRCYNPPHKRRWAPHHNTSVDGKTWTKEK